MLSSSSPWSSQIFQLVEDGCHIASAQSVNFSGRRIRSDTCGSPSEGFVILLAEPTCHDYVLVCMTKRITTLPRTPNFARYLRDARIRRGLSVAKVAEQVGVSTASIYILGD